MMSSLRVWKGGGDICELLGLEVTEFSGAWTSFGCENLLFWDYLLDVDARLTQVSDPGRYHDSLSDIILSTLI